MSQADKINDMADEHDIMKAKLSAIAKVILQNRGNAGTLMIIEDILSSELVEKKLVFPRKTIDLSAPHDGRGPG